MSRRQISRRQRCKGPERWIFDGAAVSMELDQSILNINQAVAEVSSMSGAVNLQTTFIFKQCGRRFSERLRNKQEEEFKEVTVGTKRKAAGSLEETRSASRDSELAAVNLRKKRVAVRGNHGSTDQGRKGGLKNVREDVATYQTTPNSVLRACVTDETNEPAQAVEDTEAQYDDTSSVEGWLSNWEIHGADGLKKVAEYFKITSEENPVPEAPAELIEEDVVAAASNPQEAAEATQFSKDEPAEPEVLGVMEAECLNLAVSVDENEDAIAMDIATKSQEEPETMEATQNPETEESPEQVEYTECGQPSSVEGWLSNWEHHGTDGLKKVAEFFSDMQNSSSHEATIETVTTKFDDESKAAVPVDIGSKAEECGSHKATETSHHISVSEQRPHETVNANECILRARENVEDGGTSAELQSDENNPQVQGDEEMEVPSTPKPPAELSREDETRKEKCSCPELATPEMVEEARRGMPVKGILKPGCKPCEKACGCPQCVSGRTRAERAKRFSQQQTRDIESIAGLLLKNMRTMRNLVEVKLLEEGQERTCEIKEIVSNARNAEAQAKSRMLKIVKDCNRFCKIMDAGGTVDRRIVFADEAGKELNHVKHF